MKKCLILVCLMVGFIFLFTSGVEAQGKVGNIVESDEVLDETEATASAEGDGKAEEATGSAAVSKVLEEKEDITETGGKAKGKLEQYLAEHPVKSLGPTNVLQHAIREAVAQGVPANTIVLIFLFPMITAIIAGFRHLVGLRGFGIFVPSILAVALVATGVVAGVSLFVVIILVATVARMVTRKMKLQYLPRMALIMWMVSLGVFGALLGVSVLGFSEMTVLSIFPILILILLAESFIEVQLSKSRREAIQVTVESLIMAVFAGAVVSLEVVQKAVLLYPEVFVIFVAIFNVFVGRYAGLRFLELFKFKELLRD